MFDNLSKYLWIVALGLVLLALFYVWNLRNQRDKAIDGFNRANQQIAQLIKVNRDQAGAVDLLNKQLILNDAYIEGLEQRRKNTEQVLTPTETKFKKAKNENPTVNEWANQPLPKGLY